jgi:hypothetical protein
VAGLGDAFIGHAHVVGKDRTWSVQRLFGRIRVFADPAEPGAATAGGASLVGPVHSTNPPARAQVEIPLQGISWIAQQTLSQLPAN